MSSGSRRQSLSRSRRIGRAEPIRKRPTMTAQRRERSLTIHHVTPHLYQEIGGLEERVRRLGVWFVRRGHREVVHTTSSAVSGYHHSTQECITGISIRRTAPIIPRG